MWADLDGCAVPELLRDAAAVVDSGTEGHTHLYLPLAEPVDTVRLEGWNKALRDLAGGDHKWSNESLLRLPGTWNHKSDPPRPVTWQQRPGPQLTAGVVDQLLGAGRKAAPTGATAPAPVKRPNLDRHPRVRDALAEVYDDRSAGFHRVVAEMYRAGWTREQMAAELTVWPQTPDRYASRLAEEIDRSLVKVVDEAQARRAAADPTDLLAPTGSRPRPAALPPFPVDALPPWLAGYVKALAEEKQTPLDLPGVVVLGVLAACAGGRAVVEVRTGWREPTNLYAVVVADPGHRKSPPVAAAVKPLLDVEQRLTEKVAAQIVEAEILRDIEAKTADRLRGTAAKAENEEARNKAKANAVSAAMAAEAVTVPTLPRLFADDVTPEALGTLLADNGGRMAILSAEGGIFDVFAGRYSSLPNLDVLLKAHSGDTIRVDRKGRRPEFIRAPALTMMLAVQPEVLQTIGANRSFLRRGLLARFLYALVPDIVGYRKTGTDPVPMTDEAANTYAAKVESLARTLAEWSDPAVLTLTEVARKHLFEHETRTEPRLRRESDLGRDGVREWASKMVGATARLAGLLHLAGHPGDGWRLPVEAETVTAAIELADYFAAHACAAFEAMAGAAAGNPRAERLRSALVAAGDAGLSRTDVSDLFGRNLSKDELDALLGGLLAAGECEEFDQETGGRPAKRYRRTNEVNEVSPPDDTSEADERTNETREAPAAADSSSTSFVRRPCARCDRPLDAEHVRAGLDHHAWCAT